MKTGSTNLAKWLGFLLTFCVVALFGACQGGSGVVAPDVASPPAETPTSLEQVLADLDALSAPADVDQQLFGELKQSLSTALAALGEQRFVSLAPYTDLSAVTDFSIQANPDNSANLLWTYQSQGDYDQNSEVNVADLTPVVINFGANPGRADWANGSVADGDGNGEVNLSDITPIATNYARTVSGYRIFSSPTPFDDLSWVAIGVDVPFDNGVIPAGLSRRAFQFNLPNPEGEMYYRVAPFHDSDVGPVSNFMQFSAAAIPGAPQGLDATQGTLVDQVDLSWLPLDGAFLYKIERRIGQLGSFVEVGTALPGTTEYNNVTVTAGEVYQYRVKGVNDDRESGYSTIAEGWPMRIPGVPQNLDASDGTSAVSVELVWEGDAEAAEYVIYRSTESGTGHQEIGRATELSYSDSSATTEFMYYYQVTSSNAVGESDPGNENDGWLDGYIFLPVVDSVDPTVGIESGELTLNVVTSGGAVDTYSWDFGGGATPGTSTDASPTVTLGTAGSYDASVTVANVSGEDTFGFTLTVGTNEWVHTWGTDVSEVGHGAGQDGQGNVYVVSRDSMQRDMYAVKFSATGVLQWSVGFDPAVYPEFFDSTVDSAGNVYVVSTMSFSGEQGFALSKISPEGAMLWQNSWQGNFSHRAFVRVDGADNVYLGVDSRGAGGTDFNVVVFKLAPDGTPEWMRYVKHNGDRETDEGGHDGSLSGFVVDSAGNSYILHYEFRVLKIDNAGNALWHRGWDTGFHDHPYALSVLPGGDILVGGGGGDGYMPFLVRMNDAGELVFDIGFELTSAADPGAGGLDHIQVVGDRVWSLIASDHPGGWAEKFSQLVEFDLDGNILGHWEYNTSGSASSLWSFGLAGNGAFVFTGYDNDNLGAWEIATHDSVTMDGTISDLPYDISDGTAVFVPNGLAVTVPVTTGIVDIGGGGSDMLAVKLDPASLP